MCQVVAFVKTALSFCVSLLRMARGSCISTSSMTTSCSASAMDCSCVLRPIAYSGFIFTASSARFASLMALSNAPVSWRLIAVLRRSSTSSFGGLSFTFSRSLAFSFSTAKIALASSIGSVATPAFTASSMAGSSFATSRLFMAVSRARSAVDFSSKAVAWAMRALSAFRNTAMSMHFCRWPVTLFRIAILSISSLVSTSKRFFALANKSESMPKREARITADRRASASLDSAALSTISCM
mmetsp:Transcript_12389/g.29527  ORF Transcript_12389/g.29527 Transcript_12389/m.29527 type:complete len:241 (-) Transcript_12389:479-1201(-)